MPLKSMACERPRMHVFTNILSACLLDIETELKGNADLDGMGFGCVTDLFGLVRRHSTPCVRAQEQEQRHPALPVSHAPFPCLLPADHSEVSSTPPALK